MMLSMIRTIKIYLRVIFEFLFVLFAPILAGALLVLMIGAASEWGAAKTIIAYFIYSGVWLVVWDEGKIIKNL